MKRVPPMSGVAAAAIAVAACGATGGGMRFDLTPPAPTQSLSPTRPSTPDIGVVSMISDAIASLDLTTDQNRQVAALLHNLQERHAQVEETRKRLSLDIAATVEAGAVDEKGLRLDAESLGRARADVAPTDAKGLEELHGILTPEQRKQFAAALNVAAGKVRSDDSQRRYGNWRSDLDITIVQNEKIEPRLDPDGSLAASARAEQEAWARRMRATASDFTNDAYTATANGDPDVVGSTVERVRRLTAFLNAVLPYLTPEQRKTAGANLRAEVGVSPN
jgi:Spy/CpxP family protein refolding chaperone